MEIELAHSLNITLDENVTKQIVTVQQILNHRFKERRTFDPAPHLSLLLRFAHSNNTRIFMEKLVDEFSHEQPFTLMLSNFSASPSGEYIFLNLSEFSNEILTGMNQRAANATKEIGTGVPDGASARYLYFPHISLIKLLPEESALALGLLHDQLVNIQFHATELTITVDDASHEGVIKVIRKIPLQG